MEEECKECDFMLNYEAISKWSHLDKCPSCGVDTQILKDTLKNQKVE